MAQLNPSTLTKDQKSGWACVVCEGPNTLTSGMQSAGTYQGRQLYACPPCRPTR